MRALERQAQSAAAVGQHRDALYRVCCGYAREEADRQDICQEVFIHIWRSLDSFRGQSNLGTWMCRVAVSTCLGWLRGERRRCGMLERAREELPADIGLNGQGRESSPDNAVRRLNACVARLAPVDRLLGSLYLQDLPSAEIGAVLGISEGNVRVKLRRIKYQLREMLEKENHEPR
jgi:RNA polymerase sigma-70 factor (ECF subfamily)